MLQRANWETLLYTEQTLAPAVPAHQVTVLEQAVKDAAEEPGFHMRSYSSCLAQMIARRVTGEPHVYGVSVVCQIALDALKMDHTPLFGCTVSHVTARTHAERVAALKTTVFGYIALGEVIDEYRVSLV